MSHSNTKELDVYVPPLPHFPDVATAKVAAEKENSPIGINHYHTTFLLLIQTSFVIVWALFMEADARKQPKPDPGDLDDVMWHSSTALLRIGVPAPAPAPGPPSPTS